MRGRTSWREEAERAGRRALDALFPPQCPITGEAVDRAGLIAPAAWNAITFFEPPWCATCGAPFREIPAAHIVCGACAAGEFSFDFARSAFAYDPASARLVTAFKHGDRGELAAPLARFVARAGLELWPEIDLLAPIPLHPIRQWRRRFNQAHEIGVRAAKIVDRAYDPLLISRTKATPPQQTLTRDQRKRNVSGAFAVKDPARVRGRRIALIDDVFTTGSTASAAARTLKRAGAASVVLVTAARVVRGGDAAL